MSVPPGALITLALRGLGNTWLTADAGLPALPISGVRTDPFAAWVVWAGTELGVYRSGDAGASWSRFGSGFPWVQATKLYMPDDSLVRGSTFAVDSGKRPTLAAWRKRQRRGLLARPIAQGAAPDALRATRPEASRSPRWLSRGDGAGERPDHGTRFFAVAPERARLNRRR
jgi:hypothetical protein